MAKFRKPMHPVDEGQQDYEKELHVEATAMGTSMQEWNEFRIDHISLFGHRPEPNLLTRETCVHPMHQEQARLMNGIDIALRHEALDNPEIDVFEGDSGREI